jgi:hypothetical protein
MERLRSQLESTYSIHIEAMTDLDVADTLRPVPARRSRANGNGIDHDHEDFSVS